MADIEYIGKGNPDGFNIGRSDDKVGFYGLTTPITKPTLAITAVSKASGDYSTSATVVDLAAIKAVLVNLGLVTSA